MTTWVLKLLQEKVEEGRVGGQKGSGAQGRDRPIIIINSQLGEGEPFLSSSFL